MVEADARLQVGIVAFPLQPVDPVDLVGPGDAGVAATDAPVAHTRHGLGQGQQALGLHHLPGGAAQLQLVHHQFRQDHQPAAVARADICVRPGVEHAQRAERMAVAAHQRRAEIEPQAFRRGDEGIVAKGRIEPGVRDQQGVARLHLHGGVAEGGRTRNLDGRFAQAGLHPRPIPVDQGDAGGGGVEQLRREGRDLVQLRVGGRVQHVIGVQGGQAGLFGVHGVVSLDQLLARPVARLQPSSGARVTVW